MAPLAGAGMAVTVVFATLVYMALIPHSLPFKRTSVIQLATFFTNRLLPSGLGGIGFNALYLSERQNISGPNQLYMQRPTTLSVSWPSLSVLVYQL